MRQCEQRDGGVENAAERAMCRAKLAVQPDSAVECAVLDTEAEVVAHELKVPPSCRDDPSGECDPAACGECHVELAAPADSYIRARPDESCICPVLKGHDCLTRLEAIRSESLIIIVTAPRKGVLFGAIGELRSVGASVSICWLTSVDGDGETTEISSDAITATQRETLETAIEAGYYDEGGLTLAELAAELDLSESAVSQRLTAAETRLVKASFSDSEPPQP
jgi:hypothetical protein